MADRQIRHETVAPEPFADPCHRDRIAHGGIHLAQILMHRRRCAGRRILHALHAIGHGVAALRDADDAVAGLGQAPRHVDILSREILVHEQHVHGGGIQRQGEGSAP